MQRIINFEGKNHILLSEPCPDLNDVRYTDKIKMTAHTKADGKFYRMIWLFTHEEARKGYENLDFSSPSECIEYSRGI